MKEMRRTEIKWDEAKKKVKQQWNKNETKEKRREESKSVWK